MNVSREFAIQELESIRKVLGQWLRDMKKPEAYEGKAIPEYMSVHQVEGIPVDQLRAELTACAAKLEALASS
jgi:hypothetical protein